MIQQKLFYIPPLEKDIVYTPRLIAKDIIKWVNPVGLCLDPCKGDGAFYNNFPGHRDWCEISEGKDFFEYNRKVDFIIGNPPYSIFEEFLRHSFKLTNDVIYILPTNKVFQRILIMDMIRDWGGIFAILLYGSGTNIGFPFGFSVGTFHFKKEYDGGTHIVYFWRDCHQQKNKHYEIEVQEILDYLNEKKGSRYREGINIKARLKEGKTVEECKKVIDNKFQDPDFLKNPGWLCPDTLFRKSKFEKNLYWKPPLKARLAGKISEKAAETLFNLEAIENEEYEEI